jgi:hypothetical protein
LAPWRIASPIAAGVWLEGSVIEFTAGNSTLA